MTETAPGQPVQPMTTPDAADEAAPRFTGSDHPPTPSYEKARDELVSIVQRLESGGAPLDEALALWERGEELAGICQHWLDGALAKIDAARPADRGDNPT